MRNALVRGLKHNRVLVASVFLSVQCVFTAAWFLSPHYYMGQAKLLVVHTGMEASLTSKLPEPRQILSNVALLSSRLVADRVVARLGLAGSQNLKDVWSTIPAERRPPFEEWLADFAAAGLAPSLNTGPDLLTVGYYAPAPELAQAMANAFAAELQETLVAIGRRDDAVVRKIMALSTEQGRAMYRAAQQRAFDNMKRLGGVANLQLTDDMVENAKVSRALRDNELQQVQARAAAQMTRATERAGALIDNEALIELRRELTRLEQRQAAALVKLGADHPDLAALDARIAATRKQIQDTERQRAQADQVYASTLGQAGERLERDVAQIRAKVLDSTSERIAHDMNEASASLRSEDLLDAMTNQSLVALLDDAPTVDIRIIEPAHLPSETWFPNLYLVLGVSLFTGLLASLGAGYVLERIQRRVRDNEDVAQWGGVEVLGALTSDRGTSALPTPR